MVDWRLIALAFVFILVAWVVYQREAWAKPLGVAAAVAGCVACVLFVGFPLVR